MFFRTPFFLPLLYRNLIWRIPTAEKKLYLSFDDGPVPGPTDFVLEQLRLYKAKATFFCIGNNVLEHGYLLEQIKNEGHAVGNHTYNHLKGWNAGDDEYTSDVLSCQKVVGETTLFRPPYGRIKRSQIRLLSEFKIVMWDVLSYDYAKSITPDRCLNGAINASRNGSIIVFHDSYKAERNLKYALPKFLDHFSKLNFRFEAIPQH